MNNNSFYVVYKKYSNYTKKLFPKRGKVSALICHLQCFYQHLSSCGLTSAVKIQKPSWLLHLTFTWSTDSMQNSPQTYLLSVQGFYSQALLVCWIFMCSVIYVCHLILFIDPCEAPYQSSCANTAGSEIYQEMLARALAKYFGAKLLIFDSHVFLGVRANDFQVSTTHDDIFQVLAFLPEKEMQLLTCSLFSLGFVNKRSRASERWSQCGRKENPRFSRTG